MLVVLALFGVVTGAVVLALPDRRGALKADADAQALASAVNSAVDHTLRTGRGFAIRQSQDGLRLVQRHPDGTWGAHFAPDLAQLKLSVPDTRILGSSQQVFEVSASLVPLSSGPFVVTYGRDLPRVSVIFDGARARVRTDVETTQWSEQASGL